MFQNVSKDTNEQLTICPYQLFRWGDCRLDSLSTCEVELLEVCASSYLAFLLSLYFKINFNVKYVFTLIINGPDHFSFYWLKIGFSFLIFYKEISASYYQVPSCTTATPLPVSFRQTCDISIYMSFNFSLRACDQGASVRIVNQPSEALGLSGLPCVFPFRYKVGQKLSALYFEKIFGCS